MFCDITELDTITYIYIYVCLCVCVFRDVWFILEMEV